MGIRMPAEYQEVEYLESSGTQWIETDIVPSFDTNVWIKYKLTSVQHNTMIFGATPHYISGASNNFFFQLYANKDNNNFTLQKSKTSFANIPQRTDVVEAAIVNENAFFNGVNIGVFINVGTTCDGALSVFARSNGDRPFRGRVYYFKVVDGDTTIEMIPCYRKSDSKPGMYDLVSGTFFTNAGTGEFLVGHDIRRRTGGSALLLRRQILMAQPHEEKIVGDGVATFDTDFKAPMRVEIPFELVQDGTGDPSPDNVRPISGCAGCEIYRAGDNILFEPPIRQINNCAPESEGSLKYSNYYHTLVFPIPKGVLYLHKNANGSDLTVGFSNNPSLTYDDSTEDALYTKWGTNFQYTNNDYKYAYVTMARASTTPHFSISTQYYLTGIDYGQGQSIPITFTDSGDPMTVYGGTVTLNEDGSADLVSEYGIITLNGSESWSLYNRAGNFATRIAMMKSGSFQQGWCDRLKASAVFDQGTANTFMAGVGNNYLYVIGVRDSFGQTVDEFKTSLASNPLNCVLPLAQTETYHFDIGQLKSFLGTNNIWHDMNGSITAEYWKKQ